MRTSQEIRAIWLSHLLSKEPADRPRAESALRLFYTSSGFRRPEYFFWLDSPFAALWAAMLLSAPYDFLKQKIIEDAERRRRERECIERVRATLSASVPGRNWDSVLAIAGEPLSGQPVRLRTDAATSIKPFESTLLLARLQLYDDPLDSTLRLDESDELYRAERHFFAVLGGQAQWSAINPLIDLRFSAAIGFQPWPGTRPQPAIAPSPS
jgi:hypothetical protein